ncbi:MAG: hypothetical protein ABJL55_04830 [Roseibium sp.]
MNWVGRLISYFILIIEALNPLTGIRKWLLRQAPLAWRVRLIDMLWYCFLCHFLFFFAGGVLLSSSNALQMTASKIAVAQVFGLWVIGIIGGIWLIHLIRTPLIDRDWASQLKSVALLSIVIFPFLMTQHAYLSPIVSKLYYEHGHQQLESDVDWLSGALDPHDHDFYENMGQRKWQHLICEGGTYSKNIHGRFVGIQVGLGLLAGENLSNAQKANFDDECRDNSPGHAAWQLVMVLEPSLAFRQHRKNDGEGDFEIEDVVDRADSFLEHTLDRLQARVFAHTYSDQKGILGYLEKYLSLNTLVFSVFVAAAMQVAANMGSHALSMNRRKALLGRRIDPFRMIPFFARYERYLLREKPISWAFRMHRYVFVAPFLVLVGTFYVVIIDLLAEGLSHSQIPSFVRVQAEVYAVGLYIFAMVLTFYFIFKTQRRFASSPDTLRFPTRLFLSMYLPIAISLGLFLFLFLINDVNVEQILLVYAVVQLVSAMAILSIIEAMVGLFRAVTCFLISILLASLHSTLLFFTVYVYGHFLFLFFIIVFVPYLFFYIQQFKRYRNQQSHPNTGIFTAGVMAYYWIPFAAILPAFIGTVTDFAVENLVFVYLICIPLIAVFALPPVLSNMSHLGFQPKEK